MWSTKSIQSSHDNASENLQAGFVLSQTEVNAEFELQNLLRLAQMIEASRVKSLADLFLQNQKVVLRVGGWSTGELDILRPCLEHVLQERRVINVLGSGNRKTAYAMQSSDDSKHVLKVAVAGQAGLQHFLVEPLYMQCHPEFCNRLRSLSVILVACGEVREFKLDSSVQIQMVLKEQPPQGKWILLWEEEQAEECGIHDFCEEDHRSEAEMFRGSTIPRHIWECLC